MAKKAEVKKKKNNSKKNLLSDVRIQPASGALIIDKLPAYFLIICIVGALLFMLYILSPFITVIVLAAVFVIALYPIYTKFLKWLKGLKSLSSLITCLLFLLLIIIPLAVFVLLLSGEAISTYQEIKVQVESGEFDKYLFWDRGGFFYDLKERIKADVAPVVDLDKLDIKQNVVDIAKTLSTFLASQTVSLVESISSIIVSIIILFFTMYFFFKDGNKIVKKIGALSPLPSAYEEELFVKITAMVKAILFGVFLTAIAQGVLGGVGFAIAGISNPIFWGAVMAFFSMIPVVGSTAIWIPAVIILLVSGQYGYAIFLLIWGVAIIGTVDNVIRPYVIGGKTKVYPLLTFFVVLGGIWTMNFKGIIIGPLVLMVFLSFLHIYEIEYGKLLKK